MNQTTHSILTQKEIKERERERDTHTHKKEKVLLVYFWS